MQENEQLIEKLTKEVQDQGRSIKRCQEMGVYVVETLFSTQDDRNHHVEVRLVSYLVQWESRQITAIKNPSKT